MSPYRQLRDAFLARTITRPTVALDVGGGRRPWRDRDSMWWTVVDLVPGPGVDIVADMEKIPLPDRSQILILCTDALYFLANPQPALLEFRRLLKPSGRLVVVVPWMRGRQEPDGDRARFTARQWSDALWEAGFHAVEVTALGGRASVACQMLYEVLAGVPGRGVVCRCLGRLAQWVERVDGEWALGWAIVAR